MPDHADRRDDRHACGPPIRAFRRMGNPRRFACANAIAGVVLARRFVLMFALVLASTRAGAAVFDEPIRFPSPPQANGTVSDLRVSAAAGTALLVWAESTTEVGAPSLLWLARSADFGRTWSPPAPLRAPAVRGRLPVVAGDGLGNWLVAWIDDTVRVSRSNDDGVRWTEPSDLGLAASDLRVASAEPGAWVLAAITARPVPGTMATDTLVMVSRSSDGGHTWGEAVQLAEARNVPTPRPSYHGPLALSLAIRGDAAILAWAEVSNVGGHPATGAAVAFLSSDGGRAWTRLVLPTVAGLAPTVACDAETGWAIATKFGGVVPPDPGSGSGPAIESAFSTDDGETWQAAARIDDRIFGTPPPGPGLTAAGAQTWVAAWATFTTVASEVAIAHRCGAGVSWSPVLRVPEALSDVQVVGRNGEILVVGRAAYPDRVVVIHGDSSAYCVGCDDGDACTADEGDVEVGCTHLPKPMALLARAAADAAKRGCAGDLSARAPLRRLRRAVHAVERAVQHPKRRAPLVDRGEARTRRAARRLAKLRARLARECVTALDEAVAACTLALECAGR